MGGFTILIVTLTLVVLGPEVGSYVLGLTGLPDAFLALWIILRWVLAFFGHYDQIYGQLGAVIVTMLWLYYTGLVLLIGAEMNAVLSCIVEEREGVTFVRSEPASN